MMRSMSEGYLTEERTQLSYYVKLFTDNVQAGHSSTDAIGLQRRQSWSPSRDKSGISSLVGFAFRQ